MQHVFSFDPASESAAAPAGEMVSPFFGGAQKNLQIVFDAAGNGMAVWQTAAGDNEKVVYSTYNPSTGQWSEESTVFALSRRNSAPESRISLAASSSGFAIAWVVDVFEGRSTWTDHAYAKIFSRGAWSEAVRLNTDTAATTTSPIVASNGTGFMFAWQEYGNVYTREFRGGGWSAARFTYALHPAVIDDLELVSNGSGYVLKLEHGTDTGYNSRFMAVLANDGSGWAEVLNTSATTGNISRSAIASDGVGYMLVWRQGSTDYFSVSSGASWSGMAPISGVNTTAGFRLTANGSRYLLSWHSNFTYEVSAALYESGTWGAPIVVDSNSHSYRVVATDAGYTFGLRAYDSATSRYGLYLRTYTGAGAGPRVAVDSSSFHIHSPALAYDGIQTWFAWEQFTGEEMGLRATAYTGNSLSHSEIGLNTRSHGGGVTSGKVASTPGGIRVAAWGQRTVDDTGTTRTTAYARVDVGNGIWSEPVQLRHTANVRDVLAVGETIVVLFDVLGGLDAMAYNGGTWFPSLGSTSVVYAWDYAIAGERLMLVYEVVNDIRAVVFEGGTWTTQFTIPQSGLSGSSPSLATNGEDFLVTWKEIDNTTDTRQMNTRFYNAVSGSWNDVVTVDSYSPHIGGGTPKVSSNGNGFMVTWGRDDGTETISLYGSECDAAGACSSAVQLETLAGSVGSYEIASNGTGYAVLFSHDTIMSVIHNGSSWAAPVQVSSKPGNQSLRLASDGEGYLATWYTFEAGSPVYGVRYTPAGGWGATRTLHSGSGGIGTFSYFRVYSYPGRYTVAWTPYKPNNPMQMNDLYTCTWDGSAWSAARKINTGKFAVSNFGFGAVNGIPRISWIQPHESQSDPAAAALWHLLLQ